MAFTINALRKQPLTPTSPSIPTTISPAQDDIPPWPLNSSDSAEVAQSQRCEDAMSVTTALHVIATERAALANLEQIYQTDPLAQEGIHRAVNQVVKSIRCGGKLVVCGIGKSGKIGRKIEATMNSMGIHSVFLHPSEALHGDLGIIRSVDTFLLVTFSGRTPELLLLLPHIPSTIPVIVITAHRHPSTCPLLTERSPELAILLPAPIHLDEETTFGVAAPTTSTTVALALGDALAIATARRLHTSPERGPAEVFKDFHPGGAIGAALSVPTPKSVSTPMSMPLDYASILAATPPIVIDQPLNQAISDLAIPSHRIPTVVSSSPPRVVDVLLTAAQHPSAKSWVKLSSTEIIPPRRLRWLSQGGNVNQTIADLTQPVSMDLDNWLCVPASMTVDEARYLLKGVAQANASLPIVCVMDTGTGKCLGFVDGEDMGIDCV